MLKSFNAYHSYLEAMEPLSFAERGRLFTALLEYSSGSAPGELCGNERFVFPYMRSQIDRDREAYERKCRQNSLNGRKGGRPRKSGEDREFIEENTESRSGARESFSPPTLEEIEKFCRERCSNVDPYRFFRYFQEGNWRDAKGQPVHNWRQKLLTWESYGPEPARGNPPPRPSMVDLDRLKKEIESI